MKRTSEVIIADQSHLDEMLLKNIQALQESEVKFRVMVESSLVGIMQINAEGKIIFCNDSFLKIVGYEREELLGRTYRKLIDKEASPKEITLAKRLFDKNSLSLEYKLKHKNGRLIDVFVRVVRTIENNKPVINAFVNDFSVRKQVLDAYRTLVENSLQGLAIFESGNIVFANQIVVDILDYPLSELKNFSPEELFDLIHPDDRETLRLRFDAHPSGDIFPKRYEIRIISKNGDYRWLDFTSMGVTYDQKPAIHVAILDITDRKNAEIALQASEEQYRLITESSIDGIYQVNNSGTIIYTNDAFAKLCGYKKEELLHQSFRILLDEEGLEKMVPLIQEVLRGKQLRVEYQLLHKDSHRIPVYISVVPVEKDGFLTMTGIVKDMTQQNKMVEALHKSEQHYRSLAETSNDLIYIIDRDDTIEYLNNRASKFLNSKPEEIIGKPRSYFFTALSNREHARNLSKVFESGEALYVEELIKNLHQEMWLSTWLIPLRDSSGVINSIMGVSRDISQLKNMESSLRELTEHLEERVSERTASLEASKKRAKELSQKILETQEEERIRVSRVLHDETGHDLILIKYALDSIFSELPKELVTLRQKISETIHMIDQTGENIHYLCSSLRPPILDVGGINLALKELCRDVSHRSKISVHYRGEELIFLPEPITSCLYRFVQEGLTNALKHSGATKVYVTLQHRNKQITISVSDNGNGANRTEFETGLGLLGIKEQVDLIGGIFELYTKPRSGTKIIAKIPWGEKIID